jgi:DNA polymerase bacteriophage-type
LRFCLIDFETASAADLKKCGAYVYAEHPTTEILCLGYADGEGHTNVIAADDLAFDSDCYAIFRDRVLDPDVMFVAHNAFFEKCIWRNIMVPVYGWPDIPNERWHDIMAVAAMKALPLKLERAAMALRLPQQKDTGGTKVTLSLSRTDKRGYYAK